MPPLVVFFFLIKADLNQSYTQKILGYSKKVTTF